jgi:hypothetical protein
MVMMETEYRPEGLTAVSGNDCQVMRNQGQECVIEPQELN